MQVQQEMVEDKEMVEPVLLGHIIIILQELVEIQVEIQVYGEALVTGLVEMGEMVQRLEDLDQIEMETYPLTFRMEDRGVVVVDLELPEVPDLRGH